MHNVTNHLDTLGIWRRICWYTVERKSTVVPIATNHSVKLEVLWHMFIHTGEKTHSCYSILLHYISFEILVLKYRWSIQKPKGQYRDHLVGQLTSTTPTIMKMMASEISLRNRRVQQTKSNRTTTPATNNWQLGQGWRSSCMSRFSSLRCPFPLNATTLVCSFVMRISWIPTKLLLLPHFHFVLKIPQKCWL